MIDPHGAVSEEFRAIMGRFWISSTPLKQHTHMITGWWLGHPSEKYEFVNWDDEIPKIWENKIDGNQTTNQIRL